ncbi:hypothetical protein A4X06_0g3299 [Tilletia controversa]|uniref:Uncharacterized protein n=1 Tax=Tilletia controversa TaxID=13291 RepID=A0A8X7SY37_9BASI|nr:hypothetical protein A4X06_0g3299 [Tilletia controversa]
MTLPFRAEDGQERTFNLVLDPWLDESNQIDMNFAFSVQTRVIKAVAGSLSEVDALIANSRDDKDDASGSNSGRVDALVLSHPFTDHAHPQTLTDRSNRTDLRLSGTPDALRSIRGLPGLPFKDVNTIPLASWDTSPLNEPSSSPLAPGIRIVQVPVAAFTQITITPMSDRSSPFDEQRIDPWKHLGHPKPAPVTLALELLTSHASNVRIQRLVHWQDEPFMSTDPDITMEDRYASYFRYARRVTAFDYSKYELPHHFYSVLVNLVINVGSTEITYAHQRAQQTIIGRVKAEDLPTSPGIIQAPLGDASNDQTEERSPGSMALGIGDDMSEAGDSTFSWGGLASSSSRANSITTYVPGSAPSTSGGSRSSVPSSWRLPSVKHRRGHKTPLGWTDAHACCSVHQPTRFRTPDHPARTPDVPVRRPASRSPDSVDSVSNEEDGPPPPRKKSKLTPLPESPQDPDFFMSPRGSRSGTMHGDPINSVDPAAESVTEPKSPAAESVTEPESEAD